jgi:hypothetical protein
MVELLATGSSRSPLRTPADGSRDTAATECTHIQSAQNANCCMRTAPRIQSADDLCKMQPALPQAPHSKPEHTRTPVDLLAAALEVCLGLLGSLLATGLCSGQAAGVCSCECIAPPNTNAGLHRCCVLQSTACVLQSVTMRGGHRGSHLRLLCAPLEVCANAGLILVVLAET